MSKVRTYRLTVWAKTPIDDEDGQPMYTGKEVEKALIQVTRRMEPDCDVELMDFEDSEDA